MHGNPNRLFFDQKSLILLRKSEIIKQFPKLKELLTSSDRITYGLIDNSSNEVKRLINYDIDNIIKAAGSEWKRKPEPCEDRTHDRSKWERCMLCGKPNRYIYFIINKSNNIELNVGSECIDHFGIDERLSNKQQAEMRRNAREAKLKANLNESYPGIVRIIESLGSDIDAHPIILPNNLTSKYHSFINDAQAIYRKYLDGQVNFEQARFSELLEKRNKLLHEMENYVRENRSKKFVVTRELMNAIQRGGKQQLSRYVTNGFITGDNVHFFDIPEVMNMVLPLVKEFFQTSDIAINGLDTSSKIYIINKFGINWCCSHRDIMTPYGRMIFNEVPLKAIPFDVIVKLGNLYDDDSIEVLIHTVLRRASKNQGIIIETFNRQFGDILCRKNKKYFLVKLEPFIKEFKTIVLHNRDISSQFESFIDLTSRQLVDKKDAMDIWRHYRDYLEED